MKEAELVRTGELHVHVCVYMCVRVKIKMADKTKSALNQHSKT